MTHHELIKLTVVMEFQRKKKQQKKNHRQNIGTKTKTWFLFYILFYRKIGCLHKNWYFIFHSVSSGCIALVFLTIRSLHLLALPLLPIPLHNFIHTKILQFCRCQWKNMVTAGCCRSLHRIRLCVTIDLVPHVRWWPMNIWLICIMNEQELEEPPCPSILVLASKCYIVHGLLNWCICCTLPLFMFNQFFCILCCYVDDKFPIPHFVQFVVGHMESIIFTRHFFTRRHHYMNTETPFAKVFFF